MHYQTIMLSLLQESPELHRTLAEQRRLLPTLEQSARALRERHRYWMEARRQERPASSETQLSSEALEIALTEMRDALPAAFSPSGLPEPFSLDAAMTYLRQHTPPA